MSNTKDSVRLTSTEISGLWSTYINDSVVVCVMAHFLETAEDEEIIKILEETSDIAKSHLAAVEELFKKEQIPVPVGFKMDKDVIPNAPRLFSDIFYANYALNMSKFGVASHSAVLTSVAREDVRTMFTNFLEHASGLYNLIIETLLKKGVYIRSPYMPYPERVDYINKESFLVGWFGKRRPLLGVEVSHLYMNSIQNEIGIATCLGFAQVTKDPEIRDHLLRGKRLSENIVHSVQAALVDSDVPAPKTPDDSVTTSTVAPFSDKLMLFLMGILSNLGVVTYAGGLATTLRRDISAMYMNFVTKTLAYSEDGMNIMIERGWAEQPPQYPDRAELVNK